MHTYARHEIDRALLQYRAIRIDPYLLSRATGASVGDVFDAVRSVATAGCWATWDWDGSHIRMRVR